jgi:arsenate reductase-like glutaredoxin family protein
VDFHDFTKAGVPLCGLDRWLAAAGWETLLNRKGTTWRKLDDAQREAVQDAASARALMLDQPSIIKRPVVQWPDGRISVGFDAHGHRLGMGAGFYDRALRPRLDRAQPFRRPRLIGIAYSMQQVDRLEPAPWDVALDLVVTERGILRFPPHTT